MTIAQDRLAALDTITLDNGAHEDFTEGHCAMEVVAWLAGEGHTDAPACASPVLRRYTIALNDRWPDERRQSLKPYLPRMVGTGGDGKDDLREQVAARFLATDLLGPWLRLAGMDERADSLAALTAATPGEVRDLLYQIRSEAWNLRQANRNALKAKIAEHLAAKGTPVAAAVAAAAAAAVAVAVAVAVADAVADAVAVAASNDTWGAAYRAARKYFEEHPLPIHNQIRALGEQQQPLALDLLDRLIDPQAA